MRIFSSLVVASLLGFGVSAVAQTKQPDSKKAKPKPASIALWEIEEQSEKQVLAARANVAKAIAVLKETRKKAEKVAYAALCDEVFKEAKKQREVIRQAQGSVGEAEKKHLQTVIEVLRKLPDAIDKDIASGQLDGAPALKAQMQKMAKDGREINILPKATIDEAIDQMFMLNRLWSNAIHIHLSTKEAAVGIVMIGRSITRPIGLKEGEETKEMAEARKLYLQYLDEVIAATEAIAATPFTSKGIAPKVSPK